MKARKKPFHMNTGTATIILLFVIFALVTFAVLSIRASYHEKEMAEKTRESVIGFYNADSEAENILMRLDEALNWAEDETGEIQNSDILKKAQEIEASSSLNEEENFLIYQVPMDYQSHLQVTIDISEFTDGDSDLGISSWKVIPQDQGENFDIPDFWDGEIEE